MIGIRINYFSDLLGKIVCPLLAAEWLGEAIGANDPWRLLMVALNFSLMAILIPFSNYKYKKEQEKERGHHQ